MIRSYACLVSSALVRLSRPCNLGDAKASVLAGDARKIREMVQDLILPSRRDRDPELFVKIFGSGVRTLVFVAGLGGTTRYWETRVTELAQEHRIVLVDLLGFGRSPKPWVKYSVERHVDALRRVLAPLGPVTLVGHSLGALIAAAYAARHTETVERLVLISLPHFGSQDAAYTYMRQGPVKGGLIYTNVLLTMLACIITRRLLGRILPYLIRDIPREVVEDLVKHTWRSSTSSLWDVVYRHDVADDLRILEPVHNVLCIHGSDDIMAPLAPVRALAEAFSNVQLCVLEGLDHPPFLREPERCCELIASFAEQAAREAMLPNG